MSATTFSADPTIRAVQDRIGDGGMVLRRREVGRKDFPDASFQRSVSRKQHALVAEGLYAQSNRVVLKHAPTGVEIHVRAIAQPLDFPLPIATAIDVVKEHSLRHGGADINFAANHAPHRLENGIERLPFHYVAARSGPQGALGIKRLVMH